MINTFSESTHPRHVLRGYYSTSVAPAHMQSSQTVSAASEATTSITATQSPVLFLLHSFGEIIHAVVNFFS